MQGIPVIVHAKGNNPKVYLEFLYGCITQEQALLAG